MYIYMAQHSLAKWYKLMSLDVTFDKEQIQFEVSFPLHWSILVIGPSETYMSVTTANEIVDIKMNFKHWPLSLLWFNWDWGMD